MRSKTQERSRKNPYDGGSGTGWAASLQPSRPCQKTGRENSSRNQNDRLLSVPGYSGCQKCTQAGGILNTESVRNKADRSLTSGCRKRQELSHTVTACMLLSDGTNEY